MMKTWMNKTLLAVSVQMILGVAYAAEEPSLGGYETVEVEQTTEQAQDQVGSDQTTAPAQPEKPASVNTGSVEQAASSALQQSFACYLLTVWGRVVFCLLLTKVHNNSRLLIQGVYVCL